VTFRTKKNVERVLSISFSGGLLLFFQTKKFLNIRRTKYLTVVKMADAYVCKVTSVGQITLPKEIRDELEVGGEDYIILERIGDTYFLKKVGVERVLLKRVREKVKKSGITREKLTKILEETSEDVWRKTR